MNLSAGDGPSEAVWGVRRPVGRPSWAPGGPSGGRLGRQEARREAVWAARSPEPSVLPTVAAKMQVLRRLQAGRRLQAWGPGVAKFPRRKVPTAQGPTAEFLYR